MLPQARKDRIVVQDVDNETLVYDLNNDQAHCLDPLTALVWRHADGQTTLPTLLDLARREAGAGTDEQSVESALKSMAGANLLVEHAGQASDAEAHSRRDVIRRAAAIGGLAAASFSITSIVAPTPAQAQTAPPPPD